MVKANHHLYQSLSVEGSYIAHGGKKRATAAGETRFVLGAEGTGPGFFRIWHDPAAGGWTTRPPVVEAGGWTHVDLACSLGGFTVAAGILAGRKQWACDIDPTVARAHNDAHPASQG